jgi:RNA polymerase sigma-70 factor (ECF subfamily)
VDEKRESVSGNGGSDHQDTARRFRDAALPYLDDVYTLARYLLRNSADAEDAAQECYVRALRHFDSYHGPEMDAQADEETSPLWQEPPASPEAAMIRQWDAETIRRLVADLPITFREAIVLREVNELSYREIADTVGVPVGTVMSRLARARCMLRKAWIAEDGSRT